MISAIVIAIISAGMVLATGLVLKQKLLSSGGTEILTLQAEIDVLSKKIEETTSQLSDLASKKQLTFLEEQLTVEEEGVQKEKNKLKEVETKLEDAQKNVENKEAAQQEVKTSKDDDENKLKKLLDEFQEVSNNSISSERQLANSITALEGVVKSTAITEPQKEVLNELLTHITEMGSRLRELITEYQTITDRLIGLDGQHKELEDEYTKLVEQQLGE